MELVAGADRPVVTPMRLGQASLDPGHLFHVSTYVPFGWAPTSCVGAGLGIAQLMLLCHLLSTRYRIRLSAPEAVRVVLALVPLPLNFRGTITRR